MIYKLKYLIIIKRKMITSGYMTNFAEFVYLIFYSFGYKKINFS